MAPGDSTPVRRSTRRDIRPLLWAAGILLVLRVATGLWEHRNPPVLEERLKWVPAGEAAAVAKRTGKPVLYDFSAEWCGPCKQMDHEVFRDRKMSDFINANFVPARVDDGEGDAAENLKIRGLYRITAFPTLVVVSPNGEEIDRLQGYAGRRKTGDFLSGTLTGRKGAGPAR
jgi:thiol:disulfide interchange protein